MIWMAECGCVREKERSRKLDSVSLFAGGLLYNYNRIWFASLKNVFVEVSYWANSPVNGKFGTVLIETGFLGKTQVLFMNLELSL